MDYDTFAYQLYYLIAIHFIYVNPYFNNDQQNVL